MKGGSPVPAGQTHMSNPYFPHLLEPIRLGKTLFRNRIFASPQDFANLTAEGYLTNEAIGFYEIKARGGFASVCVGDCIVDSEWGLNHRFKLHGDEVKSKINLSRTAAAISRHGAVANVELGHSGKYSYVLAEKQGFTYGPIDEELPGGIPVRAMTEEQIERIIGKYAAVAAFAKQNGFGMINLHGGHGWLMTQFMDPRNTRKDRWGGSLENRMRLPLAIVEAVRKAVGPGFPLELRISGDELIEGGYHLDECIEMCKMLDGKIDLFNVSVGHHEDDSTACITHPSMFLPDGCNVKYAAAIKKHVKTPVEAVGALTDVHMMEELIASGTVDVVQLGRQSLADPDLPLKAATGRADDITRCMRCVTCFHSSTANGFYRCAVNPVIGKENERLYLPPARVKKTVLVAGGGVGGMQAALTAESQGHRVILLEKTGRLGGVLRCEKDIPFKARLDDYLNVQERRVLRSGIELHLNTEATPETVKDYKPDVIVAALGSRPLVPTFLPGWDRENVLGAEEVYYHPEKVGKRAVIIGGGLVGAELGIYLAETLGRDVTIVEMLDHISGTDTPCKGGKLPDRPAPSTGERLNSLIIYKGDSLVHGISIHEEMKKIPNLRCYASTKAVEVTAEGLWVEDALNGRWLIEADTVIYAMGQKPLTKAAYALRDCAKEFYAIGDCVSPRNILAATQEAEQLMIDIGRG